MTIKPIDLQTNISQMHEVGKHEHNRSISVTEQQHVLDKESADKSALINNKLDETRKGERTAIREDEGNKKKRHEKKEQPPAEKKPGAEKKVRTMKDDKVGRIIDVFK